MLKFPTNGYHLIYFVSAVAECTYIRAVAYDVNIIPALHKHAAAVFGDAAYIAREKKREKRRSEYSRVKHERAVVHVRDFLRFPLRIGRNGKL